MIDKKPHTLALPTTLPRSNSFLVTPNCTYCTSRICVGMINVLLKLFYIFMVISWMTLIGKFPFSFPRTFPTYPRLIWNFITKHFTALPTRCCWSIQCEKSRHWNWLAALEKIKYLWRTIQSSRLKWFSRIDFRFFFWRIFLSLFVQLKRSSSGVNHKMFVEAS